MSKVTLPADVQKDERFAVAARELGLTVEQVYQRHGLLWPDLLYAWITVLGRTVIVNRKLEVCAFEPGVLMPTALREFRRRYPQIT